MYAVLITVNGSEEVSRFFVTIRAARNWAKWCAEKFPTKIMNQVGGVIVK